MIKVYLTFYFTGGEKTEECVMASVPRPGDRLHAPEYVPRDHPVRSWVVRSVTWERVEGAFYPEVALSA